ncbi:hypothetical protein [Bosea sp. (in: a-proteobacteria)]|uniref:hypothetical protein n=1 Tax=Bosea sp. (in: a-proteobacteria) TaxID=1871050 RepID=UPI0027357F22|nr:hypothetical protein [Bosea sp. (in: a-proteobacteria)]MDP3410001.1 hypothetical protein [Bosea sp. (in: a-proteobacteria)]
MTIGFAEPLWQDAKMSAQIYLQQLTRQLSYLLAFTRRMNELDFAASLGGEFRGMQDAGWSTTITAHEVFEEISIYTTRQTPLSKAEFRVVLLLYCQLAEAGGVYESLKNIMGIVTLKPYLLWPFQDLVRVRQQPRRVIGPNANATFRDLAETAQAIGMQGLASALSDAFRDDIRNGIYHADYVVWDDGLRLRRRNGGYATRLTFDEVSTAIAKGIGFFDIQKTYMSDAMRSFHPARTIIGRLSANFPAPWTVHADPERHSFSISGSSPGPVTSPEFQRQEAINGQLGGKVLSTFSSHTSEHKADFFAHMQALGFVPNEIILAEDRMNSLLTQIENDGLWDERFDKPEQRNLLILSPWGFRHLAQPADFDGLLDVPFIEIDVGTDTPESTEDMQL